MTDREKQLIEAYIPSPRDEELGLMQYYVQDSNNRVQKVEITSIFPDEDVGTTYLVVQANTRKRIKGWRKYETFAKSDLYDNRQDCRDCTHPCYEYWERLREIQQKEDNYGIKICNSDGV